MNTLTTTIVACISLASAASATAFSQDRAQRTADGFTSVTLACSTDGNSGQQEVKYRWTPGSAGKKTIELISIRYEIHGNAWAPVLVKANDVDIGLETFTNAASEAGKIDYGWKNVTKEGINDGKWYAAPTTASMKGEATAATGKARLFVRFIFDVKVTTDPRCQVTKDVTAPS